MQHYVEHDNSIRYIIQFMFNISNKMKCIINCIQYYIELNQLYNRIILNQLHFGSHEYSHIFFQKYYN